jgi:phospholipase C
VTLDIRNLGNARAAVRIVDAYTRQTVTHNLPPGKVLIWHWSLDTSFGWYDLTVSVDSDPTFQERVAGHVETGKDSFSDPMLGW